MGSKIKISIPTPCHENWQNMTVADKGRFCTSCQKHVIDFTQSSDREIAEVFKKESNVCGRFLKSQLERDLVIPKEKSSLWMAASATVVAFLGLGNDKVVAQTEKAATVQVEDSNQINTTGSSGTKRVITGTVVDEAGMFIPGVNVKNLNSKENVQTDFDGNFSIEAKEKDVLEFKFVSLKVDNVEVDDRDNYTVVMLVDYDINEITIETFGAVKRRTFFGRVFHSVGSIFRKKER